MVNSAIRSVDNDTLLFYEPALFDLFAGGFKENVGGPVLKIYYFLN